MQTQLNETKLHEFMGKMLVDMGAAVTGPLVVIGDKLGLYKALAENGPMNSSQLAEATNTSERYVREWLSAQAASNYVEYDAQTATFSMTPEQIAVFADENSPFLMTGGYHSLSSTYLDEPKLAEVFKSGKGIAWGDHSDTLFSGVAKFFRPSYQTNLIQEWIPSLNGVSKKLEKGGKS